MENKDFKLSKLDKEKYGPEYYAHLLEQYKLYVEMADKVCSRRMLANSFFVGIHTALITAFSVLLKEKILDPNFLGLSPFLAVICLCYVWWRIVYSYRQLNSGKFKVIHMLEQMLPVAPYDAEWDYLGKGKNWTLYVPLTHVENWVPACFAIMYILLALVVYCKQ